MKGVDSAHRRNSLPFDLMPAGGRGDGQRGWGGAFSRARFAPRSLRTLVAPFRGAKSSHNSRAAARGRPAFPRRGLLPAPRKPLKLRSGEQNLHTISAALSRAARPSHPKIPEAHSASGIFPLLLSSSIYPFPVAGIPDSENSPLPGGLPCRKAGIPQSSSG